MSETVILPEMLQAGMEALAECRRRGLDDEDVAVAVYLAMSAVYQMAALSESSQTRH